MTWKISFRGREYHRRPETKEPVSHVHHGPIGDWIIDTKLAPIDWLKEQQVNHKALVAGDFIGSAFEVTRMYHPLQDTSDATYP